MNLLFTRPGFKVLQGDLLRDRADILVCPVNCVPGVMGAGLAKQFATTFPGVRLRHKAACERGQLAIGRPILIAGLIAEIDRIGAHGRDVLLFPTKDHFHNDSNIRDIFAGLANLYDILAGYKADDEEVTVAMPALGCGLGRQEFEVVGQMIAAWATGLPERFNIHLYRPHRGNR